MLLAVALFSPPFRYVVREIEGLDLITAVTPSRKVVGRLPKEIGGGVSGYWDKGRLTVLSVRNARILPPKSGPPRNYAFSQGEWFEANDVSDDGVAVGSCQRLVEGNDGPEAVYPPAIWKDGVVTMIDSWGQLPWIGKNGIAYGEATDGGKRRLLQMNVRTMERTWLAPIEPHGQIRQLSPDGAIYMTDTPWGTWTFKDGRFQKVPPPERLYEIKDVQFGYGIVVRGDKTWTVTIPSAEPWSGQPGPAVVLRSGDTRVEFHPSLPGDPVRITPERVGWDGSVVFCAAYTTGKLHRFLVSPGP